MNKELTLKLQAYVDGELDPADVAGVEALLKSDAKAAALCEEMRMLNKILVSTDEIVPVPASREFYWSRIAREIEKPASAAQDAEVPAVTLWAALMRWFVPVGSALALIALVLSVSKYNGGFMTQAKRMSLLHEIEAPSSDEGVMEFHDASSGLTVVWMPGTPDKD